MNKQDVFKAWAPRDGEWSAWAKPVLFAHLGYVDYVAGNIESPGAAPPPFDLSWAPRPGEGEGATLVIDLPGAAGVWAGVALSAIGYRPVPLYNACPDPGLPGRLASPAGGEEAPLHRDDETRRADWSRVALVDVDSILRVLASAAPRLAALPLPVDAPPAFLLDADRRYGHERFPMPGRFDNRSVSFPTDFPSANLLLTRGIRRAVLVQEAGGPPQPDLAHTLRRWQESGIQIELKSLDADGPPVAYTVVKPSGFRSLWHRMLVAAGLRRNPLGGFGGTLPDPSAG